MNNIRFVGKKNINAKITFLLSLVSIIIIINWHTIEVVVVNRFLDGQILAGSRKLNESEPVAVEQEPVVGDKHIMFLETRCAFTESAPYRYKGLLLDKRQACALESAAKVNPEYKVYLLYTCPIINGLQASRKYVQAALAYPNIRIWRLYIHQYVSNTPLEQWNFSAAINTSQWPIWHSSDVLRLLALWKYGGTYLDLDIISLKSIDNLPDNFVVLENPHLLANGVLRFAHDGVGHEVTGFCLEEIRVNYRGDIWIHNGHGLVTRIMHNVCNTSQVSDFSEKECRGVNILPIKSFFPTGYDGWMSYFAETKANETLLKVKDSYGVHLFNYLTKNAVIRVGSTQPLSTITKDACPNVVRLADGEM